jgi:uncharacterized protein
MRGGVGIGFRPEIAGELLRARESVDFLEVVAESLFSRADWKREAIALGEIWPIVPHGVKLSLASAEGVDLERAKKLGELSRELRATVVTEHIALTRAGGREIGHLTAVPFTPDAVAVVARNVAATQRLLPDIPFLLENIAWTLRWPDDAMGEGDFHHEVVRATGCGVLLDVANVYANARNSGVDPIALVDSYPLHAVQMLHVAGGIFEDGFFFDTHAHAVPSEVMELVAHVIERVGDVPIVLERDGRFPAWEELAGELSMLRSLHEVAAGVSQRSTPAQTARLHERPVDQKLIEQQALLAEALLTDTAIDGFDPVAIARTRHVLNDKRIDDALPMLPRLSRFRHRVEAIARPHVESWPRPDDLVGPSDAMRIAELAVADAPLANEARFDRLMLRARFVERGRAVQPRVAPFVGRERIGARTIWAFKGPGKSAAVRVAITGGGAT